MAEPVIVVERLSKLYELGTIGTRTLQESLERHWYRLLGKEHLLQKVGAKRQMMQSDHPQAGPRPNTMWALKDVSFTVKQGEVLGIIGRNGAGKSTLLKILTRITEPTSGRAILHGRVASLLEVGTGFHPELTGRENIYLSGTTLGMKKAEIDGKFDEIVAFAGTEQFLDTPVKRYSSGMYVRLAFGVAAHLDPEILLVDEVLSVGDAEFQKKCLGKLGNVAKGGRTVLFVSHNMVAMQSLCQRALLIREGAIQQDAEASEVIGFYLKSVPELIRTTPLRLRTDRSGDGRFRFLEAKLADTEGHETRAAKSGEDLTIALDFVNSKPGARGVLRLAFENANGQRLFMCLSRSSLREPLRLPANGRLLCRIPRLPLLPGSYRASIKCTLDEVLADAVSDAVAVDVVAGDFFGTGKSQPADGGDVLVSNDWEVTDADAH
jgi:lipopolysaccharide transport system ATP-binding protein